MTNTDRILALLAREQAHIRMITAETGLEYVAAGQLVTSLLRKHQIVILGSASEAGYTNIRRDAPIYGLPGAKLVRVGAPQRLTPRLGKSGVIAGPITVGRGSVWGAGRA